ncbi:MAG: diguanylate cyclase [Polyangiales bacterium]
MLLAVGCWSTASVAHAAPLSQSGQWLRPSADPASAPRDDAHASRLAQGPGRVDVHAWYEASFDVPRDGSYVIDFQSSSTIASFRHFVFDARGVLLATHQGGITHAAPGPFPMRHGRELTLPRGRYHLRTELRSPFLLGLPEPYVEDVASYRQAIKAGNTLALLGLGVLLGLGFYYAALALLRWRAADAMYTVFIAGNVLYNGTALLVFGDLLGWRWFYLVSVPILFSNAAYVVFVMSLLDVERGGHPRLYRLGQLLLGVFVAFVLVAALRPAWSLELDRLGVALFSSYGLAAAVARARDGHPSARLYLVAVGAFFLLAFVSISLSRMTTQAVYIEHLGLLAVVVEAGLLALVLAHQFSVLRSERDSAEHRAREGHRAAHSDALTGLPNRKALDIELSELPEQGCLTFIDLDGLKHYNDKYGHQRGDELLCSFADELHTRLGDLGTLFRLSGDEFAITCPCGEQPRVEACLAATIEALRAARFRLAGASSGTVHVREDPGRIALKHTADTRMYEDKRRRRPSVMAEWTRESSPPPKSQPPDKRAS